MNSPREMDDADSDATYCSEAETKYGEGRLNANQASTTIITQPNGKEKSQYECITYGKTSEDLFEDQEHQEIQESIIPDSVEVRNSSVQPVTSKNITQATNTEAITQVDTFCRQEISIFCKDEVAHGNIIPDSGGAQCSNVQPLALKNITNNVKVGVDTQADNFIDESADIIPVFQRTLSFPKDNNELESSKKNLLHGSVTATTDYQKKNYWQQNYLISHSEPLQATHKSDQHPGLKDFHSEPSKFKSQSAIKHMPLHDLPKKKLLEHHRVKMKTHYQTLTSRLYSIKNEVSLHFLGCGPKLEKTRAMAFFEEVKVLRQILTQLYDASERLVSYIGGKVPLKSTEYSASDQTCEKLLVQLNPETFREDFTPLQDKFDSDREGDQMSTEEIAPSQDYEEENPEIMEVEEDNSPRNRIKVSKNVHFQSPLINRTTHAYPEILSNTMTVGRLNEGQNAIPPPSALKRAYSQIEESANRENLVTAVYSEASVMHRHGAKSLTLTPEERPKVEKNQTGIDNYAGVEYSSSQRLDDASTYFSDDSIRVTKENSKSSSQEDSQISIYDVDETVPKKRSISSIRGREYPTPDGQAPSPGVIFTDEASSIITRISQPQLCYLKNINETPTAFINSQQKTHAKGDPRTSKKGDSANEENMHHALECNDSYVTGISQESVQLLNHNAIIPCPQLTSTHVDMSEPLETNARCQTWNEGVKRHDTSLTYLESTNNQNAKIVESINVIPREGVVAKVVPEEQIITQASENSSINIEDIPSDCFSSDENTQISCPQPPNDRINIPSSECTYINYENHSQCLVLSSRGSTNQKVSTRSKDVSFETEKGYLSQENRDSEVNISESLSKSQPPGWCNIFEQHKEKRTLPTLTELMIAGMISPGEMVLSLKGSRAKATLLKNAKIMTSEGATFHTPMAWCSAWHEGKTVSRTLAYHRVYYNSVTLMDICQRAFEIAVEEMASAIQEKRRREHSADVPAENSQRTSDTPDGHSMNLIGNDSEIAMESKKESPEDIIMAIHSVYIHNDDEYVDESCLGDFLDTGTPPTMNFNVIDQW